MGNNKSIWLIITSLVIAAACSHYQESVTPVALGGQVSFSAAVCSRVEGDIFDKDDVISVAAMEEGSEHASNSKYSYTGSIFSSSNYIGYSRDEQQLSFYAIYPAADGSLLTPFDFEVEADQSSDEAYELSDLLVASTAPTSLSEVELLFSHKMSSVVMNIISSSSIEGSALTYSAKRTVNCDLIDDSFNATGEASDITANPHTTSSFEIVLPPQIISAGSQVATFTLGSKSYTWHLNEALALKSGSRYTFHWDLSTNTVIYSGEYDDWEQEQNQEYYLPKYSYITPTQLAGDAEVLSGFGISNMWDGTYYTTHSSCYHTDDDDPIGKCVTFGLGAELDITRFMLYPRGATHRFWAHNMIKYFNIYGAKELTDEMYTYQGSSPDFTEWSPILMNAYTYIPSGSSSPTDDDLDWLMENGHIFDVPEEAESARFIRIEFLERWGTTDAQIQIGEVDFWGYLVDSSQDEEVDYTPDEDGIIRVSSLEEMQPLLKMSNVNVELAQGTYYVTTMDIVNGKYANYAQVVEEGSYTHSIFLLEGNNSTYDFSGSTVIIDTDVFDASGCEFFPLHFLGNNNIVKNLTQIDEGEAERIHPNGVTNVVMDGSSNRLEAVTLHTTGSYPYRYGEIFGKGSTRTIAHYKHCGVLVRGYKNHVLNCNIYHKAYGHCLFMQAADEPIIEGCYIEAEVSTTEAVYSEIDTGSPADNISFLTVWGFYMTENYKYTMSLSEEGIRAYNGGNTMINGIRYSRGASNTTIINNEIKNARAGVTQTHASGTVYVEGCIARGCDRGYAVNNNAQVVDCYADAQFGPVYGVDYSTGSGNMIEITIIDGTSDEYVTYNGKQYRTSNGTGHIAYIQGNNHDITFRDGRVNDKGTTIYTTVSSMTNSAVDYAAFDLGGDLRNIGEIWMSEVDSDSPAAPETIKDEEMALTGSTIRNYTDWPMRIDENVTGNTIYTNGSVTQEKSGENTIYTSGQW